MKYVDQQLNVHQKNVNIPPNFKGSGMARCDQELCPYLIITLTILQVFIEQFWATITILLRVASLWKVFSPT